MLVIASLEAWCCSLLVPGLAMSMLRFWLDDSEGAADAFAHAGVLALRMAP